MSAATAAAAMPAPVVELPRAWAEITHRAPKLAETMTAYLRGARRSALDPPVSPRRRSCLRQFASARDRHR